MAAISQRTERGALNDFTDFVKDELRSIGGQVGAVAIKIITEEPLPLVSAAFGYHLEDWQGALVGACWGKGAQLILKGRLSINDSPTGYFGGLLGLAIGMSKLNIIGGIYGYVIGHGFALGLEAYTDRLLRPLNDHPALHPRAD